MADALQLPTLPADIDLNSAHLPRSYELCQIALSECARVDECKTWQAKAEALASYAKQLGDKSLFEFAQRIRNRAVRRAGELLDEIKAGEGAREGKRGAGDPTPFHREDAAREAGLSKHQQVQAVRIARVPETLFEKLTEGRTPATLSALAEVGKKLRPRPRYHVVPIEPAEYAERYLLGFRRFARQHPAAEFASSLSYHEQKKAIHHIEPIRRWLNEFEAALKG